MINFFKTLSMFLMCLEIIYSGKQVKLDKEASLITLWKQCSKFIKGVK